MSIACGNWNSQELSTNQSVLAFSTTSRALKQAHLSGSQMERELIAISSPILFVGQTEKGKGLVFEYRRMRGNGFNILRKDCSVVSLECCIHVF